MTEFFALLTDAGLAKIANAQVLGATVRWTSMAVGDGNGAAATPRQSATALVHETYRAGLNTLAIDDANPNWLVAELVIPPETGGWTIREAGIVDADGDLVAIANVPDTYKPQLSQGSGRETVLRIIVETGNADRVELRIDPTVVLATRRYVDDKVVEHLVTHAHPDGLPYAALPYPTIATPDHRLSVTPAAAMAGGTVAIAAGTLVALGTDLGGGLGRLGTWTTPAWQSPDLAAGARHYLRARIEGGALEVYVQQGTDADTAPAGLTGTPGGAAGGGFDSTVLDVLIALVVTAAAGSVPAVTSLANSPNLWARYGVASSVGSSRLEDHVYNWGRAPHKYAFSFDSDTPRQDNETELALTIVRSDRYFTRILSRTWGPLTAALAAPTYTWSTWL